MAILPSSVERPNPPLSDSNCPGTRPGLQHFGCRARRARSSHPSGSRLGTIREDSFPSPWRCQRPRKPSVPGRVQLGLPPAAITADGRTGTWLAAAKAAPILLWLTLGASPSTVRSRNPACLHVFTSRQFFSLRVGSELAVDPGEGTVGSWLEDRGHGWAGWRIT
mgnify:CR=1 FL=1